MLGMATPSNWIELVVNVLTPLLVTALAYVATRVEKVIAQHVKNESAKAVLLRMNDAIFDAVGEVEQTLAGALKEAAADGKITKDEALTLRNLAVSKAKTYLGSVGVEKAREVLGLDEEAFEQAIVAKIERAIAESKR